MSTNIVKFELKINYEKIFCTYLYLPNYHIQGKSNFHCNITYVVDKLENILHKIKAKIRSFHSKTTKKCYARECNPLPRSLRFTRWFWTILKHPSLHPLGKSQNYGPYLDKIVVFLFSLKWCFMISTCCSPQWIFL